MTDKSYTHNAAFRRVAGALRLTKRDIVEIVALGGETISASLADGWKRDPDTFRKPDAGSHNPGNRERRGKPITDDQWEAFWYGLDDWLHENSGNAQQNN
ncbi:MAG: hypothetical protein DIZ77_08250 [endosymbiont of Seepiophila jonesi]|uniref:DUF1456 domain-containing protein n=1 Tax=endosymbiont of Lamellibrachia luymesi TaxID=2200907 RepID=A0A370DPT5_9GAMM|nr:MAG: hypothetical protein DIZ79_15660 [endosymbiont of Lamellibrachia luymesi]RDH92473.1 MAG: hypothetical protein DIZ77_08250 [endosymbiont of Seepiophila jonesi]